jgi:leader peptidase (prepilin peptidase)/N-methyltransferase
MYFNNVHILLYVAIAIIGLIVGKFTAWCNIRLPEKKKIFSLEFFEENKKGIEKNYIFMLLIAIIYVALLYKLGFNFNDISKNIDLLKFMIIIPMLILTFFIDMKHRIIPNRLNLTIMEFGLIITFIYGITNVNLAKDYILGMFAGAGIFIVITLIGWVISGKEAMGLGDVKFMGAIGLYFGINGVIEISILSFVIGAICSIIILFVRLVILKSKDEYIPFGPFLALASFLCIFLPDNFILDNFMAFCKIISDRISMF